MKCAHHWVIASPAGPTVHGVCKLCHLERDWPTYLDSESPWTSEAQKSGW